jgi:hypothetical protein
MTRIKTSIVGLTALLLGIVRTTNRYLRLGTKNDGNTLKIHEEKEARKLELYITI